MAERCYICKFGHFEEYSRLFKELELGHCRRHAPHAIRMDKTADNYEDMQTIFPVVASDDWCGEYQPEE